LEATRSKRGSVLAAAAVGLQSSDIKLVATSACAQQPAKRSLIIDEAKAINLRAALERK
jgi:hypothetical protein